MPFSKGLTGKNSKIRDVDVYVFVYISSPAVSSLAFLSLQGTEQKTIHIAKLQQKLVCKLCLTKKPFIH